MTPPVCVRPAWSHFDAKWYGATYAQYLTHLPDEAGAIEGFYHEVGRKLEHSPNAQFDEAWYLAANPDVRVAVQAGGFASGFEHYGLDGHKSRSPHWLFSEDYYQMRYLDLTADALSAGGYANGYDHYLRAGDAEFRSGHWLFDPGMHRAAAPSDRASGAEVGEFTRFLLGNRSVANAHRLSWYFDPDWYQNAYPGVQENIAGGFYSCALEHYLCNAMPTRFSPNAHFSEAFYRGRNPDLGAMMAEGHFRNGFEHFLRYGAAERRQPHPAVDLEAYFRDVTVQREISQGLHGDAFAHFESTGGAVRRRPADRSVGEVEGRALYAKKCENLLPALVRTPLDFSFESPDIAVIIIAHNNFAFTMATLASLRGNYVGSIQLVLVDSGSRDEIRCIEQYVRGVEVIRFPYNIGFVDGCNAALERVRARTTLYLNNDVQLQPGAVTNALRRLWAAEGTGAVGGKIIRTHGRLQEAGSIIWRDGWCSGYLRDADPNCPEANFVRPVDFCSAAFLLCKTELLHRLGGFDGDYRPAYFEEADLAVRMRQAGFATIYDPNVVIEHYEGSTSAGAVHQMMERSQPVFRQKNAGFLHGQNFNHPGLVTASRSAATGQRRILFIEDRLPFRHLGSGFVRSNDVLHAMAALGYHVTLYPIYRPTESLSVIQRAFPDTVEVIHDRELPDLEAFVAERAHYYDAIWIARTHNAERLAPVLAGCAAHLPTQRVILDTEAVAAARTMERERFRGGAVCKSEIDQAALKRMLEIEFGCAFISQRIVAVNRPDAALIERLGYRNVGILGHAVEPVAATPGWESRQGVLFLASIPDEESPNLDALGWFSEHVLPLLDRQLPPGARFAVAGHLNPRIDLSLLKRNPRVDLLGSVSDLQKVYGRYRVFVAPTRFAGGIPYKLHEAAAHGVPIVASDLLIRQVGWIAGEEIAPGHIEDPAQFAEAVTRLHEDREIWTTMQARALGRISTENRHEDYAQTISEILTSVMAQNHETEHG